MGGLVQQPAALGAHWQHSAGRSRGALLRHTGTPSHGGVTQNKRPPANPGRFSVPLWIVSDQAWRIPHRLDEVGATHFLMKRLPKVATEMALHVRAYNLTRVMNIV